MPSSESLQVQFADPALLDRAMNQALARFVADGRKGYRLGMKIRDYVLYDEERALPQSESAALLSLLRAEVNRIFLERLRKAAGLDAEGFSRG
jgi:hypothetical protein